MSVSDDLYERDGVAWAEQQAAALRRREAGHNQLDYENLAEEVEDVGRSIARSCESYLLVIIEHLLKLQFVDSPRDRAGWRRSVRDARYSLGRDLTPTLRARMPAQVADLFEERLGSLVEDETLASAHAVRAALPEGYSWTQLVDRDWYPEPAGSIPSASEQRQAEDERQA